MTAGYFEDYIIPALKGERNTPIPLTFIEFYEIIVAETAFSVFVSVPITDEELKTHIIQQSFRNITVYDRDYVSIHALGYSNVEKVNRVVSSLKEEELFPDFIIIKKIFDRKKLFIQLKFGEFELGIPTE